MGVSIGILFLWLGAWAIDVWRRACEWAQLKAEALAESERQRAAKLSLANGLRKLRDSPTMPSLVNSDARENLGLASPPPSEVMDPLDAKYCRQCGSQYHRPNSCSFCIRREKHARVAEKGGAVYVDGEKFNVIVDRRNVPARVDFTDPDYFDWRKG